MVNTYTEKKYHIFESTNSVSNNCKIDLSSNIVKSDDPRLNNFIANINMTKITPTPVDLVYIEKYISDELKKFLEDVYLINRCKVYNNSTPYNLPINCTENNTIRLDIIGNICISSNKPICQRAKDLNNMILNYSSFISVGNATLSPSSTREKYNEVLRLRNQLNEKINEIYSQDSKFGNSKLYLDSTVYTSVLWTILATTILFYIFKKM